jgi:hypothetical protein
MSDRVAAAVTHCNSRPSTLLSGSLKQYLGSCRWYNNEVIMAVHEWMWMQEPNFYHARILELTPRCGRWSIYHKSIMLGIVCYQMYVLCVWYFVKWLYFWSAMYCKSYTPQTLGIMQHELPFIIMLCFGRCPSCIVLKYKKLITLQRPNTEWY